MAAVNIPADLAVMQVIVTGNQPAADALTITARYSDQNAFMCMLDRIGCDTKEKFRLLHDGFNTMEQLVDHFMDDIDAFKKHLTNNNKTWLNHSLTRMRSFFSPVLVNKLLGVLYYYHTAVYLFHSIPDLNLVDNPSAIQYGRIYNQNDTEKDNDGDISDKIVLPELSEAKDWTPFKEKFFQLLELTIGAHKMPVRYVVDGTVRTHLRANAMRSEVDTIDMEDEDLFLSNTVHFGAAYKSDNKLVWNLLANALLNKPSYNHISTFNISKDGRGAWFALRTFYEGENYLKNLREIAFNKLQNTFYRGETNRYNFEKYVNSHKQAHKMLQDAQFNNGLGIDNSMKVQYFRQGIKSEAGIEVALATSRSQRQYEDFEALISFLAAEVEHYKLRKVQLNNTNRRLSSMQKGGRGGRGGGRGGRGRGGGTSSRRGPYTPVNLLTAKRSKEGSIQKTNFPK